MFRVSSISASTRCAGSLVERSREPRRIAHGKVGQIGRRAQDAEQQIARFRPVPQQRRERAIGGSVLLQHAGERLFGPLRVERLNEDLGAVDERMFGVERQNLFPAEPSMRRWPFGIVPRVAQISPGGLNGPDGVSNFEATAGKFMSQEDVAQLLARIAGALERLAPPQPRAPDFSAAEAFVWRAAGGAFHPVSRVNRVDLALLKGVDRQRDMLFANTSRFAQGLPANNALHVGRARHGQILAGEVGSRRARREGAETHRNPSRGY